LPRRCASRSSGAWIDQTSGLRDVTAGVYTSTCDGPARGTAAIRHPPGARARRDRDVDTIGLAAHGVPRDDNPTGRARGPARAKVNFFSGIQDVPTSQVTYAGGVRKRLVYFHDPEGNLLELCEYKAPPGSRESGRP
jgi:catechol 2,3-dioxygenase-like lactoylglutathione lyase family enzyme